MTSGGAAMDRGRLDAAALERQMAADEIDTVVVAFTDLQGRLVGKRVTGRFFSECVLAGGVEACNYLLAVDVDMTPLPGYRFASWEQGYGDLECRPDLATLRRIPCLDKTALVLCDLFDAIGPPVERSPRQTLRRPAELAAALGFTVMRGRASAGSRGSGAMRGWIAGRRCSARGSAASWCTPASSRGSSRRRSAPTSGPGRRRGRPPRWPGDSTTPPAASAWSATPLPASGSSRASLAPTATRISPSRPRSRRGAPAPPPRRTPAHASTATRTRPAAWRG